MFIVRYVLFRADAFAEGEEGEGEFIVRGQRYQCRVAFADTHGAADLLGDDHSAEVVDPSDNSCCFHIYKNFLCFNLML